MAIVKLYVVGVRVDRHVEEVTARLCDHAVVRVCAVAIFDPRRTPRGGNAGTVGPGGASTTRHSAFPLLFCAARDEQLTAYADKPVTIHLQ